MSLESDITKLSYDQLLAAYKQLDSVHESVCHQLSLISEKVEDAFVQGYLSGKIICTDEDEADAIYLSHKYINKVLEDEQESN